MAFIVAIARPAKQPVVERHASLKLFLIVAVLARQSNGYGQKAWRDGMQIVAIGVGSAYRKGQTPERFAGQSKILEHCIKRTAITPMAKMNILNVKWYRIELICSTVHLRRGDKQEFGVPINETADQPRAGNAVNFGPCAGNPCRGACGVKWDRVYRHQRQTGVSPRENTAL